MLSLFTHDCAAAAAAALIFSSFCLLVISHDNYLGCKRKGLTQPPARVSRLHVAQFQVPSWRAFPELHRSGPCVTNTLPSSFGWKMESWNGWVDHHRPSPYEVVDGKGREWLCNLSRVTDTYLQRKSSKAMSLLRLAARQRPWTRTFASKSSPPSTGVYQVFDRAAKRKQRDRAASKDAGVASRTVDYVRDEVADRMMERLLVSVLYAV